MELSLRERDRMAVMRQAREGALAVSEAAARLGMTRHHTRRLMRRFERGGDGAAVHGLRGRRSNRTHAPEVRKRVLALAAAAVYSGFGPTALGELVQWGDSLVHPWIEDRGSASRSRPPTRATRIVGRDYTVRWKNGGGCRASCASVAASGTSPPSRWAPSVRCRRATPPAPSRPRPKPPKPGSNHPWRKQIRAEVERAVARQEGRLARLAAATTVGNPGHPVSDRLAGGFEFS